MADDIQKVITDFTPIGVDKLQEAYNVANKGVDDLNKKVSSIDPSLSGKKFADFGGLIDDIIKHSIKNFSDFGTYFKKSLDATASAANKLPADKLKKFNADIASTTDEFEILSKTVKLLEDNLDDLKLNPKELKTLQSDLKIAGQVASEYSKKIKEVQPTTKGLGKEAKSTGNEIKEVGNQIKLTDTKTKTATGQLRAMKNELVALGQAGKQDTVEFRKLQAATAELQDDINDARQAVTGLASDTSKIDAGIGAIRGVVAGFTVYQGILGLTGAKNEQFEKTLLKINGTMAVLQGVQEIANLLQKESVVRIVATNFAQGIWNTSIALSTSLFGKKAIAQTTDIALTEAQTVVTADVAVASEGAAVAVGGLAAAEETAAVSTGVLTGALAATVGIVVALGVALGFAASYISNKLRPTLLFAKELDELNQKLIDRVNRDQELAKIREGGLNDQQREIDILKEKGAGIDVIFTKEKALVNQQIKNGEIALEALNKHTGSALTPLLLKEIKDQEDAQRDLINKKSSLDIQYNKDRQQLDFEYRTKDIELLSKSTNIYTKEVTARVAAAKLSYDKDLANFDEQQKKILSPIRYRQYVKEVEEINRNFQKARIAQALEFDIRESKIREDDLALNGNQLAERLIQFKAEQKKELDAFTGTNKEKKRLQDEQAIELKKNTDKIFLELLIKQINNEKIISELRDGGINDIKRQIEVQKQLRAPIDEIYINELKVAKIQLEQLENAKRQLVQFQAQAGVTKERTDQINDTNEAIKVQTFLIDQLTTQEELQVIAVAQSIDKRRNELEDQTALRHKQRIAAQISLLRIAAQAEKESLTGTREQIIEQSDLITTKLNADIAKIKEITEKNSIGELLFGNDTDFEKKSAKAYDSAQEATKRLIDEITQAQIEADDQAIKSQENKVSRFLELAEYGSAEQLQIEQDRLASLQREREKDVQQQKELAAIQVALSNSITIANGIAAITAAFAPPTGGLFQGIAASIALAATVASTVLGLTNAFGSIPAFAEGTEYVNGPGGPKSDSINARLSKGERVVPSDTNAKLNGIKNKDLPRMVELGQLMSDMDTVGRIIASNSPNIPNKPGPSIDYTKHFEQIIEGQKDLGKRISAIEVTFGITPDAIHGQYKKTQASIDRIHKIVNG